MKARGKRKAKRARRPWIASEKKPSSPEGAKYGGAYFGLSGLAPTLGKATRGDVLRFAPHLPLAVIFRTFGILIL